jgi:hypothetical protein
MIFENKNLFNYLFYGLNDYKKYIKYIKKHSLQKLIGISHLSSIKKKIQKPNFSVDPNNLNPFPPEIDDLTRLHYLTTTRRVITILEFGIGKSTIVFNDALIKNKKKYKTFVYKNLRKKNQFECHSLDNQKAWIKKVKSNKLSNIKFHFASLKIGTFNDRVCTFYKKIPNVTPDLIYLDGPDQFSAKGHIRAISTNHPDRLPMSGDVLALEHFLYPGTLIVVDGRTANARFLKTNLQRDWIYCHDKNADQHFFELREEPLGVYNKRQIDFCLGYKFYVRLKKSNF